MGFFNKQQAESGPTLAKLSSDRVKATLDSRDANYGVDDDGDIGGYWDGHLFYFFLLGKDSEYLQVRGRWNRKVAISQIDRVTRSVNQWNADKLWPKVYVRPDHTYDENGEPVGEAEFVAVYAEHTVDYEHGLSDEQLDLHLACAITTTGQFFDQLDEEFPAEAAAGKAEFERE